MGKPYDTLIILVGGNNIPNLYAIKQLLRNGGTLILIHSKDTLKHAQIVVEVSKKSVSYNTHYIQIDLSDPKSLNTILRKELAGLENSIHFHYTGGTKFMVTSTLFVLESLGYEMEYSYIFSDRNHMTIHGSDGKITEILEINLCLTLDDLLTLHFLGDSKPRYQTHLQFPKTQEEIAKLIITNKSAMKNFTNKRIRPLMKKDTKNKLSASTPLKFPPAVESVKKGVCEDLNLKTDSIPLNTIHELTGMGISSILRWFDGSWLESYVYDILDSNRSNLNINELGYSLEISPPNKSEGFELDVFCIIQGVFFGISCTTDSHNRSNKKKKLFEVSQRATQIGGSEARSALVSFEKNPESLEEELVTSTRLVRSKIKVFGIGEFSNLETHLIDWIKKNIKS